VRTVVRVGCWSAPGPQILNVGLSAWEQACHLALTTIFAGQEHSALSVSDPHVPPLILHSDTQRARCAPETIWLQNTPGLSATVAHLGRSLAHIRWDRLVSNPVVVSLGGQHRTWLIDVILISSSRVPGCRRWRRPWPLSVGGQMRLCTGRLLSVGVVSPSVVSLEAAT
jgi:hypothetical protein